MNVDNDCSEDFIKITQKNVEDYAERYGYNETFLDEKIPLPKIPKHLANDIVHLLDGSGYELKYANFSVIMSKSRSLAFFTAVNIDGNQTQQLKRDDDHWYFDPRIDRKFQYGPEVYTNKDLDRGHLVRRLDPVWGPQAMTANNDTFHFTNAAPQHKLLNRKTWLDLEDYILKNANVYDLKINVFTGPVFSKNDMIYKNKFLIPIEFWKVVTMIKNNKTISSTGYLQTQKQLLENLKFVFGEYKTYQVPITKIETITSLDFGKIRNFDPLNNTKDIKSAILVNNAHDIIL